MCPLWISASKEPRDLALIRESGAFKCLSVKTRNYTALDKIQSIFWTNIPTLKNETGDWRILIS